jgi:flagellar motility protein MotE (MotC chaperone)
MDNNQKKEDIDKILSLSKEELSKIFEKMSASEIADLLDLVNEVAE